MSCLKVVFLLLIANFIVPINAQSKNDSLLIKAEEYFEKGLSFKYKKKDSALIYLNKSYCIFENNKNWLFCIYILQQINSTTSWHYDLQKLDFYIKEGDFIFKENQNYFDTISDGRNAKNHHLVDKINYWYKMRDYDRVHQLANKLRSNISQTPDSCLLYTSPSPRD